MSLRSAVATTVVLLEVWLFDIWTSLSAAVTVPRFVIAPPEDGAVKTIEIGGASPTESAGRVQGTMPLDWEQDQPFPEASTNVTPEGSVSVIVTDVARLGPALETLI